MPTLAECEEVIERGRQTFIEVGVALGAIRDGRLYREEYATFEVYCRKRWGMSATHAYRQIAAAKRALLSPIGEIENEHQARRLLEEESQSTIIEYPDEWRELISVMDAIEQFATNDAAQVAANVPRRRIATTAKRLRKLGTYLGRIAWLLEGNEASND